MIFLEFGYKLWVQKYYLINLHIKNHKLFFPLQEFKSLIKKILYLIRPPLKEETLENQKNKLFTILEHLHNDLHKFLYLIPTLPLEVPDPRVAAELGHIHYVDLEKVNL